jgi:prepilin-type processing-associated H-X9-DG protein
MRQLSSALNSFAADNGRFPDWAAPSSSGALQHRGPWDLQLLSYLGIQDGYTGSPTAAVVKTGLNLEMFRCPLDSRGPAKAGNYPRSYGISAVTVYYMPGFTSTMYSGGIQGRTPGQGLRLAQLTKPSSLVVLTRAARDWEIERNSVGVESRSIYNGPSLDAKPGSAMWEQSWAIFGGRTPYAFADGHVSLVTQEQAKNLHPAFWKAGQ